jgi:hypothetical protein
MNVTETGIVSFTDYTQVEELAKRLGIKRDSIHNVDLPGRVHRFSHRINETTVTYFRFAFSATETLTAVQVSQYSMEDGHWVPNDGWTEEPTMATVVALFLEATA